jgi:hypothetical protein
MQIWQDLIKYSLIGSERQNAPLNADGDLQAYISQLYPNNTVPTGEAREQALLSAAALAAQYRLAGQQAATFNGTLPAADDAEPLPLLSPLCISHLQRLLNDSELKSILPEWLALAATVKRRVPFASIPQLLELATQNRSIRPAITALIDKRGQWLAAQHPDWQKLLVQTDAILDDVSIWEDGSPAQREEYLRQYRAQDAAKARELLQAVWKQESAATRQSLLSVFSVNLSSEDEAFLNTCLEDRSKGVRQLAAILLGQLHDSAFSQRQKQRLNTWLRFEKGGLLKKAKLIVELPETWDKTWLADGIEEKPPQGKGAKAWWLEQALSVVPPAYWSAHWHTSPDDILTMLKKHEWRDALLMAWRQALQNYPDSDWAETFLAHFNSSEQPLWQVLNAAHAERLAAQLLTSTETSKLSNVLPILNHVQHAWSVDFSKCVINTLQRHTQQKLTANEAYAYYYLSDFARHLAPECTDLLSSCLQKPHEYEQITRVIDKMFYMLSFRRDMTNALTNP